MDFECVSRAHQINVSSRHRKPQNGKFGVVFGLFQDSVSRLLNHNEQSGLRSRPLIGSQLLSLEVFFSYKTLKLTAGC